MSFDTITNRIGTHSAKWDMLETLYDIKPDEGIAMWVADMDFPSPQCILQSLQNITDHGVLGYYGDDKPYLAAICNWMDKRHNWQVNPAHIFTTHGLVNGIAICIQTFTNPGDSIILFTPVYHAFSRIIKANNRDILEFPLINNNARYEMDFNAYERQLTGRERMMILSSPHNPGGRVWTKDELIEIANFCEKHNLILISDEVHHDIVFKPNIHIPMPNAAPHIQDRLVMMTSASKTFNIAGGHVGNVIIKDEKLRKKFSASMAAAGMSPNSFGLHITEAAYSHGAAWLDDLVTYLNENRLFFDAEIAKIPGLKSMPLEATYLAWVDFSNTGMSSKKYISCVQKQAKIATSHGSSFGKGGDDFLRFNLGMPRSVISNAVKRLQLVFSDL